MKLNDAFLIICTTSTIDQDPPHRQQLPPETDQPVMPALLLPTPHYHHYLNHHQCVPPQLVLLLLLPPLALLLLPQNPIYQAVPPRPPRLLTYPLPLYQHCHPPLLPRRQLLNNESCQSSVLNPLNAIQLPQQ